MVKVSETPGIAPVEFAERRRGAVEHAKREGLRGLLVFSRGGGTLDRYADVLYLTNFYTPFPYIPDLPEIGRRVRIRRSSCRSTAIRR